MPDEKTIEYEDEDQVRAYSEKAQRENGDCLSPNFISALPERFRFNLNMNDLTELICIWEGWERVRKGKFEERYGHIASLMQVEVDDMMIRAAVQFWDPSYRCFVFNEVDLMPTIEEYSALMGMKSDIANRIYRKERRVSYKKKFGRVFGSDPQMANVCKDDHHLPWPTLKAYMLKHADDDYGLTAMALAIYGLVIFPKEKGYVDFTVVDPMEQVDDQCSPVPAVVAETLRSLNFCREKGGQFIGCSQLLSIWLKSHLECIRNAFISTICRSDRILEFRKSEWLCKETWEEWVIYFANLKSTEVVWKAPWKHHGRFIYRCGIKPWVPLIGLWGITSYAPLMVRRQLGQSQFVPMTHELNSVRVDYGGFGTANITADFCKMWNSVYVIDGQRLSYRVSVEYVEWRSKRINDMVTPREIQVPVSTPAPRSPRAFDAEKTELMRELEEAQEQAYKWKTTALQQTLKVRELIREKAREKQGRREAETSLKSVSSQHEAAREEIYRLQDQLRFRNRQSKNIRELREENQRLVGQRATMGERADGYKQTIRDLHRDKEVLQENLVDRDRRIDILDRTVQYHWQTNEDLNRENERLKEANEELKKANEELNIDKARLQAVVNDMIPRCNSLLESNQKLQQEYSELEDLYKRVFESREAFKRENSQFKERQDRIARGIVEAREKATEMINKAREIKSMFWSAGPKEDKITKFLDEVIQQYRSI